jgi:hypothetical protein
MKAGSGETVARPGVPKAYVMNVPPAGDGSVSRTWVESSSLTSSE